MGNTKAKPVLNAHPLLGREVERSKCVICFEESKDGLKCKFSHLICQECVTPLINSVVSDVGRLKDQRYGIRCPWIENGKQCQSECFNASVLRDYCDSDTLDRYVKVITDICRQNDSSSTKLESSKSVVPKLLDALNLRCPNKQCRTVMDPSPDGCCAVRCAACATYTCFLCFSACRNSTACHQHVRNCVYSPKPDELFISEIDRIPALKRIRVLALREVLATEFLPAGSFSIHTPGAAAVDLQAMRLGAQLQQHPSVAQCLLTIQQELRDVHLSPQEVLELDTRPVATKNNAHPIAPEEQEAEEEQLQEQEQEHQQAPERQRQNRAAPVNRPPAIQQPIQHAVQPAPAAAVQRPNPPPTWRAVALGVLTFFVVFAAFMYGFYILASVANRSSLQGIQLSQQQQQQQQRQQPVLHNDGHSEPANFLPYTTCPSPQPKRGAIFDNMCTNSIPYSTTYEAFTPAQPEPEPEPSAPVLDRALQLATGLSCHLDVSLESSDTPPCDHLWAAMVVFGEGLVQLTVLMCVLSMAGLFGCLVLDVVSK